MQFLQQYTLDDLGPKLGNKLGPKNYKIKSLKK